ncbi:AAA family ATPase [Hyphomicrobiales bacterium]|nr:AAA family ATPase [Hyphomicrobiales bacterium]
MNTFYSNTETKTSHTIQEITDLALQYFPNDIINKSMSTKRQLRLGTQGKIAVELVGDKRGVWYNFAETKGGNLLKQNTSRSVYAYTNGIVVRDEKPNGKDFSVGHYHKETGELISMKPEVGFGLYQPNKDDLKRPILIVEGEKTVDEASKLFPDYHVCTWQGGASNIAKNITNGTFESLNNRKVTLWADNDNPGIKAMNELANYLLDREAKVSIVDVTDLPKKWDLADVVPEGIDITSKLGRAVIYCGGITPIGASKYAQMNIESPEFIYPDILPVGSAVLGGMPKLGKSYLAMSIAKEVVDSGKGVSIFSFEDHKIRAKDRLKALGLTDYDYDQLSFMTKADIPSLRGYDFIEILERYMNEMKHDLYIIDPIAFITIENVKPSDYEKCYPFYGRFSELAHEHNCCILLISHVTKGTGNSEEIESMDKILGGRALTGATDTVIYAKKQGKDIVLEVTGKDIINDEPLYFDRQLNGGFVSKGTLLDAQTGDVQKSVLEHIESRGAISIKTLAEELDKTKQEIGRACQKLADHGKVCRLKLREDGDRVKDQHNVEMNPREHYYEVIGF